MLPLLATMGGVVSAVEKLVQKGKNVLWYPVEDVKDMNNNRFAQ